MTPRTKFKFLKPYYAFLGHPKTYSKIWFVYFTKCRRNSGKQDFLWKSFFLPILWPPWLLKILLNLLTKQNDTQSNQAPRVQYACLLDVRAVWKKKTNVRDGRTIGQNRVTTIYPQFSTISNVYFQFQSKKFDISRHN